MLSNENSRSLYSLLVKPKETTMEALQNQVSLITTVAIVGSILITVIVLAVVFLVFRRAFSSIGQSNRLLATGEAAQATVLRLWDTGVKLNDNPQVGLVLEVRPTSRPAYQVETKCFVSLIKLAQVQPGALVNVKFDPMDPNKVALALA
jgi:hypothetical protein